MHDRRSPDRPARPRETSEEVPRRAAAARRNQRHRSPSASGPRPAEARSPDATADGIAVQWDNYQPGDVFAHVFAGLPGFEHVQAPGEDAGSVAAGKTAGASRTLPHAAAIQRSFGSHDVSGIVAHLGGDAADAADALDAEAFAVGNHVAFARAPDLHTAAHEAAHVIQQQGGVARKARGGAASASDALERHADAVADRVVAGESAEQLLSLPPANIAAGTIQRKARGAGHEAASCEGTAGPEEATALERVLGASTEQLDSAQKAAQRLATIAAFVIDTGGQADEQVAAIRAKANLVAADRGRISQLGNLLLGLAEAALGLAEILSPTSKVLGGLLKVGKGSKAAVSSISTPDTAEVEGRVGKLEDAISTIAEYQQGFAELFVDKEVGDLSTKLRLVMNDSRAVARSIAISSGCQPPYTYEPSFLADVRVKLAVQQAMAQAIQHAAREPAMLLKAAGAVGPAAMRSGAAMRTFYDEVAAMLAEGRGDDMELVQHPHVQTVVVLNSRTLRDGALFRTIQVETSPPRFDLVTTETVARRLMAEGISPTVAPRATPERGGVEHVFAMGGERGAALRALSTAGLRCRNEHLVEFAIGNRSRWVLRTDAIANKDNAWLTSEQLVEVWKQHVGDDVEGFLFDGQAYAFDGAGRFKRLPELATNQEKTR